MKYLSYKNGRFKSELTVVVEPIPGARMSKTIKSNGYTMPTTAAG